MVYSFLKNNNLKVKEIMPKDSSGIYYGDKICDPQTDYRKTLNSLGYRSPEFSKDTVNLFAGCSHTWGFGMTYDSMWANIVAKNIGGSYSNVAVPGISVARIVQNIIAYCRDYGNPKNIFILFPNIDRIVLPKTDGFLQPKNNEVDKICDTQIEKEKLKYFKAPLLLEEIVTEDIAIWLSLQSIQFLEQYCKSSGINLFWSSWEKDFNNLINKFKNENYYYDYTHMDFEYWTEPGDRLEEKYIEDCHRDLINENNLYYWSMGGDREAESEGGAPHFGAHRNIHIAEYFINRYKEKNGRL